MRVDWNDQSIQDLVTQEWRGTMDWLQARFIMEFTTNKWAWPTGQSPRDIIDTANLRSQTLSSEQARVNVRVYLWTWNAEYALAVHNGATFLDGRVYPARPWTKKPLAGVRAEYQRRANRALRAMP